jgi:hypothetical protein
MGAEITEPISLHQNETYEYTNVKPGRKILKKNDGRKRVVRQTLPMKQNKIDDVIYPIQTKKGLKWDKRQLN